MDNFLSALVDKVNDLLFEMIGLLLPSLILCIITLEPVFYIKDFSIQNILPKDADIEPIWIILFLIAFFYVIGNVIKVVSKIYYNLGKAIFNDTIFALIYYMFNRRLPGEENSQEKSSCQEGLQENSNSPKKSGVKIEDIPGYTIFKVLYEWIKKTLSFSVENYDKTFEHIYIDLAVNKLKWFNKEEKDKKWYLFYKRAITILDQENVDTLYYKHLSKYNSFRSLECVFFCAIIYNIFWIYHIDINVNYQIYYFILGLNIVCLISFHEKYKRYWRLCGNEVIVGLDYFYNYSRRK